jgi:hypothetical protein
MFGRPGAVSVCVVLSMGITTNHAYAETSCAAGDSECGRAAFARGTESFDRGKYAEAASLFRAAANADPHPTVVFNLALSEARSGRVMDGMARFRALLEDARADAVLRARVETELRQAESRLARVSFDLPDPSRARIFLDGVEVAASAGELAVDPRPHRIRVESGGEVTYDQDVDLSPGERLKVRVTSRTRSIDVVLLPAGVTATARPASKAHPSVGGLSKYWFFAAAAGTAALGGLTLWSGLDVQRAHDDYTGDLPRLDQAEADARVDDGHARERRTNWLLAATTVSAAGTAVLGLAFTQWSATGASVSVAPLTISATARF